MTGTASHHQPDTPREARIKSIFCDAAAIAPESRAAFVNSAAGDDRVLAREVFELIEADSQGSFLDGRIAMMVAGDTTQLNRFDASASTPLEPTLEAADHEPIPIRIGRYAVIGRLGAGASGVVYEARQEQPARGVAVKLLHPGANAGVPRRRFVQEAQLMALLVHPAIAHAYELDIDPALARPYIAMELVPGARRITDYAREHKLDAHAMVRLVVQACEAVHYAHSKGVIHRDLKPANLLVSNEGNIKIVDFGVARLTTLDQPNATTAGSWLIGTLEYVSPEQIRGEAGTASDLYSIAAILYELICGRPPIPVRGQDIFQAFDRIRNEQPQHPSKLNPACNRDLAAILLRALSKSPEHRYESVAAFGGDLSRYLRGENVLARPPGPVVQLFRAAKRRPALTVGLAAIAIAVLGGWAWSWREGEREKQTSSRMIAAAADAMDFLQYRVGARPARQAMFEAYLPVIKDLAKTHPRDPRLQRLLARLCSTGGDLARDDGNPRALRIWREKELAIMRNLVAQTPTNDPNLFEFRHALSLSVVRMGNIFEDSGECEPALNLYLEALEIQEQLSVQQPLNPALADDVTWSYRRIGTLYERMGDSFQGASFTLRHIQQADRQLEIEGPTPRSLWALYSAHQAAYFLHVSLGDEPGADRAYGMMLNTGECLIVAAPEERRYVSEVVNAMALRANFISRELGPDRPAPRDTLSAMDVLCRRAERILADFPESDNDTLELLIARTNVCIARAKLAELRADPDTAIEHAHRALTLAESAHARGIRSDYFNELATNATAAIERLTARGRHGD
ncbi:MAG: serine/threonine protein kinase [Planctomycetes bacterium]|nr:serine/threonine protein kinase [Planctomycetota bacterium]